MANTPEPTLYDEVTAMAEKLGLEGEERGSFVHQAMTKAGWTASPHYDPPEGEDKTKANVLGGTNWFGKTG